MLIKFTQYADETAAGKPETSLLNYSDFRKILTHHIEKPSKKGSPVFGLYVLKPGMGRGSSAVEGVSGFVFDVDFYVEDSHPEEQRLTCRQLLVDAGIEHLWYTTFAYPEKPSWRLIIPFEQMLQMDEMRFRDLRLSFIQTYRVPIDYDTSKDISHIYYLPITKDLNTCRSESFRGDFFDVSSLPPPQAYIGRKRTQAVVTNPEDIPEEDAEGPVDLEELRKLLKKHVRRMQSKIKHPDTFPEMRTTLVFRQNLIINMLRRKPIAPDGERYKAMLRLCWELAFALPLDTAVGTVYELCRGSVEAMQAKGSKLNEKTVRTHIRTAFTKRRAQKRQAKTEVQELISLLG